MKNEIIGIFAIAIGLFFFLRRDFFIQKTLEGQKKFFSNQNKPKKYYLRNEKIMSITVPLWGILFIVIGLLMLLGILDGS